MGTSNTVFERLMKQWDELIKSSSEQIEAPESNLIKLKEVLEQIDTTDVDLVMRTIEDHGCFPIYPIPEDRSDRAEIHMTFFAQRPKASITDTFTQMGIDNIATSMGNTPKEEK